MNVADLELCEELHKLSGWETPYFFTQEVEGKDKQTARIRYDLRFLLHKLPAFQLKKGFRGDFIIRYEKLRFQGFEAENIAARLAIELIKQGVIPGEKNE